MAMQTMYLAVSQRFGTPIPMEMELGPHTILCMHVINRQDMCPMLVTHALMTHTNLPQAFVAVVKWIPTWIKTGCATIRMVVQTSTHAIMTNLWRQRV
jgi:hypothetical protein